MILTASAPGFVELDSVSVTSTLKLVLLLSNQHHRLQLESKLELSGSRVQLELIHVLVFTY
jgi:hypothetical protein